MKHQRAVITNKCVAAVITLCRTTFLFKKQITCSCHWHRSHLSLVLPAPGLCGGQPWLPRRHRRHGSSALSVVNCGPYCFSILHLLLRCAFLVLLCLVSFSPLIFFFLVISRLLQVGLEYFCS